MTSIVGRRISHDRLAANTARILHREVDLGDTDSHIATGQQWARDVSAEHNIRKMRRLQGVK